MSQIFTDGVEMIFLDMPRTGPALFERKVVEQNCFGTPLPAYVVKR